MNTQIREWTDIAAELITAINKHPGIPKDYFSAEDVRTIANTIIMNASKDKYSKVPDGGRKVISGEVTEKGKTSGSKDDGTRWTKYFVVIDGEKYSSFDRKMFSSVDEDDNVELTLEKKGKFLNVVKVKILDPDWSGNGKNTEEEEEEKEAETED